MRKPQAYPAGSIDWFVVLVRFGIGIALTIFWGWVLFVALPVIGS